MGSLNANVIYIKIALNGRVKVKMNVYSEQQQSKSSEKSRFRDPTQKVSEYPKLLQHNLVGEVDLASNADHIDTGVEVCKVEC